MKSYHSCHLDFRPIFFPFPPACSKQAAIAGGFDWPHWRGPDGNGQSRETDWDPAAIANPKILWNEDIGFGYSNVVIQNGRLYTAGRKPGAVIVYCLDAATGKHLWKRSLVLPEEPSATPTIEGDSLFMLTKEGYLYCIKTRSGKQRWRRDLVYDYGAVKPFYGFAGSPVVDGDLVILTANTAGMAVKRETGELAWSSEKPPSDFPSVDRRTSTGGLYSTPVLYETGQGRQALLYGWNGLSSVDVKTGKPSWRFAWDVDPAGLCSDPIVIGDRICLPYTFGPGPDISGYGALLRLSANGPVVRWRAPDLYSYMSTPVIVGGAIFTSYGGPRGSRGNVENALHCVDLESGEDALEERLGGGNYPEVYSLIASNGDPDRARRLGYPVHCRGFARRLQGDRQMRRTTGGRQATEVLDPARSVQCKDLLPQLRRRPHLHRREQVGTGSGAEQETKSSD